MREIKFKYVVKTKHGIGEITFDFSKHVEPFVKESLQKAGVEFHDIIAKRQFTGLKDRNGREIYESDIILSDNMFVANVPLIVTFTDGCFHGAIPDIDETDKVLGIKNLTEQPCEVIGNIYEHGDILNDDN